MSVDVLELWDFSDPAASEERFAKRLANADPDERFILQTQIARTYGLRKDFERAQAILSEIGPYAPNAGPEAKVRFLLESGRAICSPAHPPASQSLEVRETARPLYMAAFELAKSNGLDYLAIDALHMMAMVDIEPTEQLEWDLRALAYLEESKQEDAKKWEASLRHNVGYALSIDGRYREAMHQFERALAIQVASGKPSSVKIARFMIAKTMRQMGRLDESRKLFHELENVPPPSIYVFQELETIYRQLGDEENAHRYTEKVDALS